MIIKNNFFLQLVTLCCLMKMSHLLCWISRFDPNFLKFRYVGNSFHSHQRSAFDFVYADYSRILSIWALYLMSVQVKNVMNKTQSRNHPRCYRRLLRRQWSLHWLPTRAACRHRSTHQAHQRATHLVSPPRPSHLLTAPSAPSSARAVSRLRTSSVPFTSPLLTLLMDRSVNCSMYYSIQSNEKLYCHRTYFTCMDNFQN